jgi:uncharacterized membrane protein
VTTVLLLNAAATLFMVGLIWFVQVVHYPLFAAVGRDGFVAYHAAHSRLTTFVVGVPMLVEAATAALLLVARPAAVPVAAAWAGLALVGVIWLSTAALQVPQHGVLAAGLDPAAVRALVLGNWLRTAAWTARGALVLWLLARALAR